MNRSYRLYLILGSIMVTTVLLVAIFAGRLTTVSPYYMDGKASALVLPPPYPPSAAHPLGTDDLGRDIWTRVAYGARWSLLFAMLIAGGRLLLAVPMAGLGSVWPRGIGALVNRLHIFTSAVPPLILYLFILDGPMAPGAGFIPTVVLTVVVLTLLEWPRLAVTLMGRLEELGTEQFVEGAVAVGASPRRIFWTHLLPHLWPTLVSQAVGEMGRALLVIAQLGVFGVLAGGSVAVLSGDGIAVVSGVPEWGQMLASSRSFIARAPWMPLVPAFAFLFTVTGFNVLAQGAEVFSLPSRRWREATTGRLSRHWRRALVPVALGVVVWFYGGFPWGRMQGIQALAGAQTEALAKGDVDGYLATVGAASPAYQAGQRRWADSLVAAGMPLYFYPDQVKVFGHEATVLWGAALKDGNELPPRITRPVHLVRRWGRWYETGPGLTVSRGFYSDVYAWFDPLNDSRESAAARYDVSHMSTSLDHAWAAVIGLLPPEARNIRPQAVLYASEAAFEAALVAAGVRQADASQAALASVPDVFDPAHPDGWRMAWDVATGKVVRAEQIAPRPKLPTSVFYRPGEPIRLSPALETEWGTDPARTERFLGELLIQYALTEHDSALLVGAFEQAQRQTAPYPVELDHLAGGSFYTLPELFSARLGELSRSQQSVYVMQSVLLVEYLKQHLSESQIRALAMAPDPLPAIAGALGTQPAALSAAYDTYLMRHVAGTSILTDSLGRGRTPVALTDAIAARAAAAAAGDEGRFLTVTASESRDAQLQWLRTARQAGLRSYTATLLDLENDVREDVANTYVLERLEFDGGRMVSGIVHQTWIARDGAWMTATLRPET
ncbi:MAG: ABC transporter permease subunit [Symbiobacteriia bacterium]